jgi:putative tricarboxylic transport membrane protein
MSLLFPVTLHIPPVSALIMMAGIYYGAMYGGSTTSILVNIPGEAASVITCLDGYQMARKGRAGVALGMSALGSFIGGTLSILALQMVAPPLAKVALAFGFPEYFSLICCGLVVLTFMARGSMIKALMMAAFGIFLGTIGTDLFAGIPKFTFGIRILYDGLGIVPVVMGLFGISEVLLNIEEGLTQEIFKTKIKNLFPTRKDWGEAVGPISRGTFIGFFLGILPGAGPVISSFTSYAVEKKLSKHPEKFGTGVIQAVAGPETANNAATAGGFVPLLTLGIPTNSVLALMLAALMLHGVTPGPLLLFKWPDVFWGVIASMYIGNVMLLVLNLPMIGLFVQLLKVPYSILSPLIVMFVLLGAYALNNSVTDVLATILFGMLGYLMKRYGLEPAPLVLAYVLGPMLENNLSKALIMARSGGPSIFFTRPISGTLLTLAILVLAYPLVRWCWRLATARRTAPAGA